MLLMIVGILGFTAGVGLALTVAKRGTTQVVPDKASYFQGLLDGYNARFDGCVIELRNGDGAANGPQDATHALLWYPVPTESGILWAKVGVASSEGVTLEQDRVA